MRKKIALLLAVIMMLSILPALPVSGAQARRGSNFTPRRTEIVSVARFAGVDLPQVTSPASIDVTSAISQRWVRNTDEQGTYVAAQFFFNIEHDGFILATPTAIGLNVEASRQSLTPTYAFADAEITVSPTFAMLDWEGRIYAQPDNSGTLMLEFVVVNANLPTGTRAITVTADFYTEQGVAHEVEMNFDIVMTPPANMPTITVANPSRILTTGHNSTLDFAVTTAGIAGGAHQIEWFIRQGANEVSSIPGITLPQTLTIGANGAATLSVTGTPTTTGVWYATFSVPLDDNWYAYHFIRLEVEAPRGTGGGGGGPSEAPPAQRPPSQPSVVPPPSNTTVVVVNNVNKVIVNQNVTSVTINNTINQAVAAGQRPVVTINVGSGQDGIKVGGNDVKNLIENNGVLVVVKNNVSVSFTSVQMSTWNINVDSEVVISLRPVEDREEKRHKFRNKNHKPGRPTQPATPDQIIDLMVSVLVEVNIMIDGIISIDGADSAPTISVDISHLTAIEIANLKGVFFFLADPDDPDSLTYILLDGEFDGDMFNVVLPDGKASGWFTLMSIEMEIEISVVSSIRLQLGSTAMSVDGDNRHGLDVAPFLADPNDPDSLMLPIRSLANALGADVHWNASVRVVTVINIQLNINFSFSVDQPLQDDDGDDLGEPDLVDGRTFVPRRFMSEMMGVTIDYDQDSQEIYISNDAA
ncbi:MAG: copper amine oxidase N-terminal domain-containing protein [Defluviitaleaceae bacterium]|nr:copper amine oxidase N-terminal domain-containing protein [Defluviitaleaceae bacterium]